MEHATEVYCYIYFVQFISHMHNVLFYYNRILDIQSLAQTSTSKERIICVKGYKLEYAHDVEYKYTISRLLDDHDVAL